MVTKAHRGMMHVPRGRRRPPRTHGDPRRPRRRRGWFGRGSWGREKTPDRTVPTPAPALPMPPKQRAEPPRTRVVRQPPRQPRKTHGDPPPRRRPIQETAPAVRYPETAPAVRQIREEELDRFNKANAEKVAQFNQARLAKTTADAKQRLANEQTAKQVAAQNNPREIPEISLTKALGNSPAYQNWAKQQKALRDRIARKASTRLANKGGLMRKGHNDMRKKGLFK